MTIEFRGIVPWNLTAPPSRPILPKTLAGEDCYVETFPGFLSIGRRSCTERARSAKNRSTYLDSAKQRYHEWPDCGESSESASRLGFGTEWHIHGHNGWWKYMEGRRGSGRRTASISRCRRRERQGRLSDVDRCQWSPYGFPNLQNNRWRRYVELAVCESTPWGVLRLFRVLDSEARHCA